MSGSGVTAPDRPRRLTDGYARLVVRFRWAVIVSWMALLWGMVTLLPEAPTSLGGGIEGIAGPDSPAIAAEVRSYREFRLPLLSRTAVVQRDPTGLDLDTQVEAAERAAAVSTGGYFYGMGGVVAAIPVANTFCAFPGSEESGTTIITYLFTDPDLGFGGQYEAAREFTENRYGPDDHLVGVTGSVPARLEQGRVLHAALPHLESVTLVAVLLIVGLVFRSLVAPLMTLVVAGAGVLATLELSGAAGAIAGVSVPTDLKPLLVALLLGVVTDYAVFYLSGMRAAVADGLGPMAAAERATARFTRIVVVAGLTVAAGTACLLVADSPLVQAFGPGMSLTVLVGLVCAVTLVPALLAVLGGAVFWPARPHRTGTGTRTRSVPARWRRQLPLMRQRRRVVWLTYTHNARWVVAVGLVCLGLAAVPVTRLDVGVSFVSSLPRDNEVRSAATAASRGFADGILSPTVLLIEGTRVTDDRGALARLGSHLERQPGVAGVLGPGDQPLSTELGVLLAASGDAARYLIILDVQALGASAINTLTRLRTALPTMLAEAGLAGVRVSFAGDTAIAAGVDATVADLSRVARTVLLVNLVLLVLFLRAFVAPLALLAVNVLTVFTSLGLTTLLFQVVLGHDGLTFYVPFAAAVLLVALGSDYTIFGVGHVWDEAAHGPMRSALVRAVPRTAAAITAAGVILATSFGLLALVPLRPFRELSFAMGVGVLLDAVVVRALLVPGLLRVLGPASGWPGQYLYERRRTV